MKVADTLSCSERLSLLISIFNNLFEQSLNTILVQGGKEPIYLPSSETGNNHQIIFTLDYFSSALHEISHWCVAGDARRELIDFGYWYEPDGRTEHQQRLFEEVEVKPQALEWIFSRATNQTFRLSVDNINQPEMKASDTFKEHVYKQVKYYLINGLPERAKILTQSLLQHFRGGCIELSLSEFSRQDLN